MIQHLSRWLACVVLAVCTQGLQAQDRPGEQERAIAALKKLGVKVDASKDQSVQWLYIEYGGEKHWREWLPHLQKLRGLQRVWINGKVPDAALAFLEGQRRLERLSLISTGTSNAGLEHLKGLTSLRHLDLSSNRGIDDEGLASLKKLEKLEYLNLEGTHVRGPGLSILRGMTRLRKLDLRDTPLTDKGLAHLPPSKQVRWVNVSETKVKKALRARQEGKLGKGVHLTHRPYHVPGEMRVLCWSLSPDGKLVVSGAGEKGPGTERNNLGQIKVWDAANGKLVAEYDKDVERIGSVHEAAFFSDGKTVLFQADRREEDGP